MAAKIPAGAIGVMLNDSRPIPALYRLLPNSHHMGIAYFEPLDDIGALVPNPIKEFWPLLDQMP